MLKVNKLITTHEFADTEHSGSIVTPDILLDFGNLLEFQQLYNAAIREISTKLEILDDEFQVMYSHNPIHHMECRLKTPQSIIDKLTRKGCELSIDSARHNLTDIAGVRVICCYIEDIYRISELLLRQDDITLIKQTDYIKTPKVSGYRSLHLVVTVPVFLAERTEHVPVEIQIRTVAMDFWASLEHQLYYKTSKDIDDKLKTELTECADAIAKLDTRMQNIYKAIT